VDSLVYSSLTEYFEEHPKTLLVIVDKAMAAARAREAARKARELAAGRVHWRRSGSRGNSQIARNASPAKSELYIVEGDSAGGSAKQGRDRKFQAILPLRGKILNVEKASEHRILKNAEIQALISAIGTGVGDSFDIERARYHRIILMTDADVDGAHIRTRFSLGQADLLRRAIGKKKKEILDQQRELFIDGCLKKRLFTPPGRRDLRSNLKICLLRL